MSEREGMGRIPHDGVDRTKTTEGWHVLRYGGADGAAREQPEGPARSTRSGDDTGAAKTEGRDSLVTLVGETLDDLHVRPAAREDILKKVGDLQDHLAKTDLAVRAGEEEPFKTQLNEKLAGLPLRAEARSEIQGNVSFLLDGLKETYARAGELTALQVENEKSQAITGFTNRLKETLPKGLAFGIGETGDLYL